MGDFWVFGYGSLIWNPGFEFKEKQKARIYGYNRALCIHSWHYRGTKEKSGLVFGLNHGGSCIGIAFKVDGSLRKPVVAYLRERELISDVYVEINSRVELMEGKLVGERVGALSYVVNRESPQYACDLGLEETARIVSQAIGSAGTNRDYVENTLQSLHNNKIKDRKLELICKKFS